MRWLPGMIRLRLALLFLVVAEAVVAAELRFAREGAEVAHADAAALTRACTVATIEVDDPNQGGRRRYRACPLAEVLAYGFGAPPRSLGSADVFIRAWDGYDKPVGAERLAEDGGWLAFGDADRPEGGWAPLGSRAIDPGPFYLVWSKPAQRNLAKYPWVWQVAEFEVVDFRRKYPHVIPEGVPRDSPAWHGLEIVRGECIACHAINREGGTTGPDLNVPQSIVEYRPVAQIKAYIRNPRTFRYGNMPAHPELSARDLDALIAYFRAMSRQKHDPSRS